MCDLSDKEKQVKNLKNGKGIQYLLDQAHQILGHPILIHDMEYKIVSYSQNVITDDPIWNEYAANGTVGVHWLDFFKNECFLEAAANAKRITFLISDKLKYDRLFGKLFNKNNIQIGCACMLACHAPFEYEDAKLFEDICELLSKELGKSQFFTDYGQAYLEQLVGELIHGISDIELYTAHVESIYMHLNANLYLAVADFEACNGAQTQLSHFRELFRKAQPEYTYAVYSNYVLILLSTGDPILYTEKDLSQLNRLFRKHNIYAGVSRRFDNLFELGTYYKDALDALPKNREAADRHIFLREQF